MTGGYHRTCAVCADEAERRCPRCGLALCSQHDRSAEGIRCERCEGDFELSRRRRERFHQLVSGGGYLLGAVVPWMLLIPAIERTGSPFLAAMVFLISFVLGTQTARLVLHLLGRAHRRSFLHERAEPLPTARVIPHILHDAA